jgi:hypothetical protein
MRVVGMAAMIALMGLAALAAPARAQLGGAGGGDGPHVNLLSDLPSKTPEEKEEEAERDRKYKDSLRKIPDAKGSNDPWGGVRNDAPKTATTKTPAAAKAKTKTGSTQN